MRTSGSGQSALLLLDVIAELVRKQIEYAVIGAIAASVHGIVRASFDADALVSITLAQLRELEREFATIGLKTELRVGDFGDPIPSLLALTDTFGNRVDLLGGLRGIDPAAFARTIEVPFKNSTMRIVGREDFIAMKVFAGGPQDLVDAYNAIEDVTQSLDTNLLWRLTERYGSSAMSALKTLLTKTSKNDVDDSQP